MNKIIRPVSRIPENNLPLKNKTPSLKTFVLLLSNTQLRFVIYANNTDKNQAMILEII